MAGYVYFLADPRTPRRPRYIGAKKDPVARAFQHAKPSGMTMNDDVARWKAGLRAAGLTPLLIVVSEHPTREAALEAEWRLLERWTRRGLTFLNGPRDYRGAWISACRHFQATHQHHMRATA